MLVGTVAVVTMLLSFTNKTEPKTALPENKVVTTDNKSVNLKNMQKAYKAEVISSAKYGAYSEKAEEEGHHQIAMMFNAISKAKSIHADNHQAVLEEEKEFIPEIEPNFNVKSTAENLRDAIEDENNKINTMYPEFTSKADRAMHQPSLKSLNYAYKTAVKHRDYHERALLALVNNNIESLPTVYFICPTCGNVCDTNIPGKCDVSKTSSENFIEVSDRTW